MEKLRNREIDFLRGLSIFVMILIHTNAYFLHDPVAKLLWDYSQFAVAAFIFCSAYLFFQRTIHFDWKTVLQYVRKRIGRLLLPYYIFLIFWFPLIWFGEPKKLTPSFIFRQLTLTSPENDISWLVLLFISFVLIMPFLALVKSRMRWGFYLYFLAGFLSSLIFLFYTPPLSFKLTMWLPWSTVIVFGFYTVNSNKKQWFFPATIIGSLILFIMLRSIQQAAGHSLIQYDNKYPPNLYHIAYGIFSISLLYFLFTKGFLNVPVTRPLLVFFSRYSYSIYFLHYLIIFFITVFLKHVSFTWITLFLTVLTTTLSIQWLLNHVFVDYRRSTLKSGPTI